MRTHLRAQTECQEYLILLLVHGTHHTLSTPLLNFGKLQDVPKSQKCRFDPVVHSTPGFLPARKRMRQCAKTSSMRVTTLSGHDTTAFLFMEAMQLSQCPSQDWSVANPVCCANDNNKGTSRHPHRTPLPGILCDSCHHSQFDSDTQKRRSCWSVGSTSANPFNTGGARYCVVRTGATNPRDGGWRAPFKKLQCMPNALAPRVDKKKCRGAFALSTARPNCWAMVRDTNLLNASTDCNVSNCSSWFDECCRPSLTNCIGTITSGTWPWCKQVCPCAQQRVSTLRMVPCAAAIEEEAEPFFRRHKIFHVGPRGCFFENQSEWPSSWLPDESQHCLHHCPLARTWKCQINLGQAPRWAMSSNLGQNLGLQGSSSLQSSSHTPAASPQSQAALEVLAPRFRVQLGDTSSQVMASPHA